MPAPTILKYHLMQLDTDGATLVSEEFIDLAAGQTAYAMVGSGVTPAPGAAILELWDTQYDSENAAMPIAAKLQAWRPLQPGHISPYIALSDTIAADIAKSNADLAAGMAPITVSVSQIAAANDEAIGQLQKAINRQITGTVSANSSALSGWTQGKHGTGTIVRIRPDGLVDIRIDPDENGLTPCAFDTVTAPANAQVGDKWEGNLSPCPSNPSPVASYPPAASDWQPSPNATGCVPGGAQVNYQPMPRRLDLEGKWWYYKTADDAVNDIIGYMQYNHVNDNPPPWSIADLEAMLTAGLPGVQWASGAGGNPANVNTGYSSSASIAYAYSCGKDDKTAAATNRPGSAITPPSPVIPPYMPTGGTVPSSWQTVPNTTVPPAQSGGDVPPGYSHPSDSPPPIAQEMLGDTAAVTPAQPCLPQSHAASCQPVSPVVTWDDPFAHVAGLIGDDAARRVEDWLGSMAGIWTYTDYAELAQESSMAVIDTPGLDNELASNIDAWNVA